MCSSTIPGITANAVHAAQRGDFVRPFFVPADDAQAGPAHARDPV